MLRSKLSRLLGHSGSTCQKIVKVIIIVALNETENFKNYNVTNFMYNQNVTNLRNSFSLFLRNKPTKQNEYRSTFRRKSTFYSKPAVL